MRFSSEQTCQPLLRSCNLGNTTFKASLNALFFSLLCGVSYQIIRESLLIPNMMYGWADTSLSNSWRYTTVRRDGRKMTSCCVILPTSILGDRSRTNHASLNRAGRRVPRANREVAERYIGVIDGCGSHNPTGKALVARCSSAGAYPPGQQRKLIRVDWQRMIRRRSSRSS